MVSARKQGDRMSLAGSAHRLTSRQVLKRGKSGAVAGEAGPGKRELRRAGIPNLIGPGTGRYGTVPVILEQGGSVERRKTGTAQSRTLLPW